MSSGRFKVLRRILNEYRSKRDGFLVSDLEQDLLYPLGFERLENVGGSMIKYRHEALRSLRGSDRLVMDILHGKKRETISAFWFHKTYSKQVKFVLDSLEAEAALDGTEEP